MKHPFTVSIIQSNYIPWRGYFDMIAQSDMFIIHDDIQYTKGDWRNRNLIKTANGVRWISVPVLFDPSHPSNIDQTKINYSIDWVSEHKKWLTIAYGKTKFFEQYAPQFFSILDNQYGTISDLNISIIKWINELLGIKTQIRLSSDLKATGKKTDRVIDLLTKVSATRYISGPAAKNYLETDKFKLHNIELYYKTYCYESYTQLYGNFEGAVTILDLVFNMGGMASSYITSTTPNEKCC